MRIQVRFVCDDCRVAWLVMAVQTLGMVELEDHSQEKCPQCGEDGELVEIITGRS